MLRDRSIFFLVLIVISVTICVSFLGKVIEEKISLYVYDEVNRVSKVLIREILDENFFKEFDLDSLFVIERNVDGEIELIDFNTGKLNDILGKINDEVVHNFKEFDKGNVLSIYDNSSIFKKYVTDSGSGIVLDVPLGIAFSNPIIVSIGPKVPIKLIFSGQVESDIDVSIKQYGINNVLLQINVKVVVYEKIIFPFSNHYVNVELDLPLVIELISGKIPENYLNNEKFDII